MIRLQGCHKPPPPPNRSGAANIGSLPLPLGLFAVLKPLGLPIVIPSQLEQSAAKISIEYFARQLAKS
jgi:hypothetical protein